MGSDRSARHAIDADLNAHDVFDVGASRRLSHRRPRRRRVGNTAAQGRQAIASRHAVAPAARSLRAGRAAALRAANGTARRIAAALGVWLLLGARTASRCGLHPPSRRRGCRDYGYDAEDAQAFVAELAAGSRSIRSMRFPPSRMSGTTYGRNASSPRMSIR